MLPGWCEYVHSVRASTRDRAPQHQGGVWCDSCRVLRSYKLPIPPPTDNRRTAPKDAMLTLDVTVLDAMPAEELSRPASARRTRRQQVGDAKRAGQAGAPGQGPRWQAARRERACFTRGGAPVLVSLLHALRSLRRCELSSPVLPRPSCLRASTSAVRVCTERRLGSSEGLAQRAGRRRSCGSGQGLGVGTLVDLLREFKLTNGRRPPLFGGSRAV